MMLLPYGPFNNIETLAHGDGCFNPELIEVFRDEQGIRDYLLKLGRSDIIPDVLQCLDNMPRHN